MKTLCIILSATLFLSSCSKKNVDVEPSIKPSVDESSSANTNDKVELDPPVIAKDPATKNNSPEKIVRCFASDKISTKTTRIGRSKIEVRMNSSFPRARGRINCTMEASNGRWRWFGKQFLTK